MVITSDRKITIYSQLTIGFKLKERSESHRKKKMLWRGHAWLACAT